MARKRGDHLWELVMPNFQSKPDVLIESNRRMAAGRALEEWWRKDLDGRVAAGSFFLSETARGWTSDWWLKMAPPEIGMMMVNDFHIFFRKVETQYVSSKRRLPFGSKPTATGFSSCFLLDQVDCRLYKDFKSMGPMGLCFGVIKTSPTCTWRAHIVVRLQDPSPCGKSSICTSCWWPHWSGVLLPVPCWCATGPMASCGSTRTSSMETRGGNDLAAVGALSVFIYPLGFYYSPMLCLITDYCDFARWAGENRWMDVASCMDVDGWFATDACCC